MMRFLNIALPADEPVPPLASGNTPVTPVVKGNPVAFVNVPLCGVPRIGVTNVGLVANTLLPVPVFVTLTNAFEALVATALDAVKPDNDNDGMVTVPVNVGDAVSDLELTAV
jgi:hypothetical protein